MFKSVPICIVIGCSEKKSDQKCIKIKNLVTIYYRNGTTICRIVYKMGHRALKSDEMWQEPTKNLYLAHIVYYNT